MGYSSMLYARVAGTWVMEHIYAMLAQIMVDFVTEIQCKM